jgi:hypothetical protein
MNDFCHLSEYSMVPVLLIQLLMHDFDKLE